jgi:hypothetical protein
VNGRWCARRTTFLSCIASACESKVDALFRVDRARDTDMAIAEEATDIVGAPHEEM